MDVAPIAIETYKNIAKLDCDMPNYGTQVFRFFLLHDVYFLQYEDYPIVMAGVGSDLYAGLNLPFEIKILPRKGFKEELDIDNINEFFIAMVAK